MEYVYGIVFLTIIGSVFIFLFGMFFFNSKTVYEYEFVVLSKKDDGCDIRLTKICEEKGSNGWKLIQMNDCDKFKITLIFIRPYTKSIFSWIT